MTGIRGDGFKHDQSNHIPAIGGAPLFNLCVTSCSDTVCRACSNGALTTVTKVASSASSAAVPEKLVWANNGSSISSNDEEDEGEAEDREVEGGRGSTRVLRVTVGSVDDVAVKIFNSDGLIESPLPTSSPVEVQG